jgi:cell shape-determining protein MreC
MKKVNFVFGYIYIVLSIFVFSFDLLSEGIVKKTLNNRVDISNIYTANLRNNSTIGNFLLSSSKIKSENELLKKQITTLQNKNNSNIELEKEIQELKTILQYQSSSEQIILTTKILGFETLPSKKALIDIGENSGVSEGDIVLDPEGNVVGYIKFSLPMYSEVLLISSSEFTLNAIDNEGNKYLLSNIDDGKLFSRSIENIESNISSGLLTTSRVFNQGGEYPIANILTPLINKDGVTSGSVAILTNIYEYKYYQIVTREIRDY